MESHRRHVDIDMKAYKVEKFRQITPQLVIILSVFLYSVLLTIHRPQSREIPTYYAPEQAFYVGNTQV